MKIHSLSGCACHNTIRSLPSDQLDVAYSILKFDGHTYECEHHPTQPREDVQMIRHPAPRKSLERHDQNRFWRKWRHSMYRLAADSRIKYHRRRGDHAAANVLAQSYFPERVRWDAGAGQLLTVNDSSTFAPGDVIYINGEAYTIRGDQP